MAAFILSSHHIPASTLATSPPSSRLSSPLPSHLPRSCQQPSMAAPSSRPRPHHPCPPPSCLRRQPYKAAFLASPVPHTRPPSPSSAIAKEASHSAALFLSSSAAILAAYLLSSAANFSCLLSVSAGSHHWLPSFSHRQQPSLAAFFCFRQQPYMAAPSPLFVPDATTLLRSGLYWCTISIIVTTSS